MPTTTVLIPTHNHGRLLEYAVRSALDQTVSDLEIFIVGDGADEATRAAALAAAGDPRVRFFDNPKGDRHGEALRHAALQEATGEIVCYLSDDDLWLPQHVEGLAHALEGADFAHALPIYVNADGTPGLHLGHLAAASTLARMRSSRFNFIPLSAAAHTRAFYRRLPHGWHPAPPDLQTDLHMWRQILSVEGCRAVSTTRATLLNFPAPPRAAWSIEQRAEELSAWSARLRTPELERELSTAALDLAMRSQLDAQDRSHVAAAEAAMLRTALVEAQTALADARAALAQADRRTAEYDAERAGLGQRISRLTDDLELVVQNAAEQGRVVDAMERTVTWRVRSRLLAFRPVAALARRRSRAE